MPRARPLLLLDVDGVLLVVRSSWTTDDDEDIDYEPTLHPEAGAWLARARGRLRPRLGDDLGGHGEPGDRARRWAAASAGDRVRHGPPRCRRAKLPSVIAWVGDRPCAWIDDDLRHDADTWAAGRAVPTLLVHADMTRGHGAAATWTGCSRGPASLARRRQADASRLPPVAARPVTRPASARRDRPCRTGPLPAGAAVHDIPASRRLSSPVHGPSRLHRGAASCSSMAPCHRLHRGSTCCSARPQAHAIGHRCPVGGARKPHDRGGLRLASPQRRRRTAGTSSGPRVHAGPVEQVRAMGQDEQRPPVGRRRRGPPRTPGPRPRRGARWARRGRGCARPRGAPGRARGAAAGRRTGARRAPPPASRGRPAATRTQPRSRARSRAASSSGAGAPGRARRRLSAMVASKMCGSCSHRPTARRTSSPGTDRTSTGPVVTDQLQRSRRGLQEPQAGRGEGALARAAGTRDEDARARPARRGPGPRGSHARRPGSAPRRPRARRPSGPSGTATRRRGAGSGTGSGRRRMSSTRRGGRREPRQEPRRRRERRDDLVDRDRRQGHDGEHHAAEAARRAPPRSRARAPPTPTTPAASDATSPLTPAPNADRRSAAARRASTRRTSAIARGAAPGDDELRRAVQQVQGRVREVAARRGEPRLRPPRDARPRRAAPPSPWRAGPRPARAPAAGTSAPDQRDGDRRDDRRRRVRQQDPQPQVRQPVHVADEPREQVAGAQLREARRARGGASRA